MSCIVTIIRCSDEVTLRNLSKSRHPEEHRPLNSVSKVSFLAFSRVPNFLFVVVWTHQFGSAVEHQTRKQTLEALHFLDLLKLLYLPVNIIKDNSPTEKSPGVARPRAFLPEVPVALVVRVRYDRAEIIA